MGGYTIFFSLTSVLYSRYSLKAVAKKKNNYTLFEHVLPDVGCAGRRCIIWARLPAVVLREIACTCLCIVVCIGRTTTTFYLFIGPSTGENLVKYVRKQSMYTLLSFYIDADVDLHSSTAIIVRIDMTTKKQLAETVIS